MASCSWQTGLGSRGLCYSRWANSSLQALMKWKRDSLSRPVASTLVVVEAYAAIGRKEEALVLIEKSYREHSILVTMLKVEPALDPLRGDLRFQELLRRVGLADR
jgi:hypothetical protein